MLPIASLSMRLAKTQNWIEFARRQIAIITYQAWLSESKDLEDKVAKMSIRTGVPSKYSNMISAQTNKAKQASKSVPKQKVCFCLKSYENFLVTGTKLVILTYCGCKTRSFVMVAKWKVNGITTHKLKSMHIEFYRQGVPKAILVNCKAMPKCGSQYDNIASSICFAMANAVLALSASMTNPNL